MRTPLADPPASDRRASTAAGLQPRPGRSSAAARIRELERTNRLLEQEVVQHRLAEELARSQSQMLIESLGMLAESHLDNFLGHVLKVTVQQLEGVGGTLWFPDPVSGTTRLHLEYVDSHVLSAGQSHHPAVLHPLPIGGRGISTFPVRHAEAYVLSDAVAGMPEENRAYINSLGVRTLLTVPMVLGSETVGWICIRSSRADPADFESKIHLAEALANQATLAVQMARLSERAREAAVLGERNRIARDIHDTLAQGFTGVVLNLEAADRTLRKNDYFQALEHIDHARDLARSCLDEARLSVRALRPESAIAQLVPALEAQARRFDVSGVRASFEVRGTPVVLPSEVQSELLRIAQECITNVLKHARARTVHISLAYDAYALRLSVVDDGVGFDPRAHHDGFGLVGIRERAGRIGARLSVVSRPAQGTAVETALPLGPSSSR